MGVVVLVGSLVLGMLLVFYRELGIATTIALVATTIGSLTMDRRSLAVASLVAVIVLPIVLLSTSSAEVALTRATLAVVGIMCAGAYARILIENRRWRAHGP